MNAPKLRVVHSRDEILEAALRALTAIVGDPDQFPAEVRRKCDEARCALHPLRSAETVRQMERKQGIGPQDAA